MILVVSKSKAEADKTAELFNIMGYIAVGVTGSQAQNELSPAFRAILLLNPDNIAALDSILYHNAHGLKIPIFALGETEEKRFDEVFKEGSSASSVIKRIIRYSIINEKPQIGKYKCAGFDGSAELSNIFFFDTPVKLTKTEKMIYRYLLRSYPLPRTANDIIKYAIRPSRTPEPSSIRTYISAMNKKFDKTIGRPMIEFYDKRGYLLITPEPKREILK